MVDVVAVPVGPVASVEVADSVAVAGERTVWWKMEDKDFGMDGE